MEKNILAALEIADHEVRLLVGQFFNGRLNILKVERVSFKGSIYSSDKPVQEAVKKVITNASKNIGVVIHSVLFLVPGKGLERVRRSVDVETAGRVSMKDIIRVYNEAFYLEAPKNKILVNQLNSKYIINGMATRKFPVGESVEDVHYESDLYYCDQELIFDYVSCVEASGIRVIDLIIDDIGFAKEASLFESSVKHPVLSLFLEDDFVRMSFFYQGMLMSQFVLDSGLNQFKDLLVQQYKLPYDVVERFVYYNVDLSETNFRDDPIFMWSTKTQTHTLSTVDINQLISDPMKSWLADIVHRCEPVREFAQDVQYTITGSGSEIAGLSSYIQELAKVPVDVYRSTTFGLKDTCLNSLVGAFYYYKDSEMFRNSSLSSIDRSEFEESVIEYNQDAHHGDVSMTQKLKTMFFKTITED